MNFNVIFHGKQISSNRDKTSFIVATQTRNVPGFGTINQALKFAENVGCSVSLADVCRILNNQYGFKFYY